MQNTLANLRLMISRNVLCMCCLWRYCEVLLCNDGNVVISHDVNLFFKLLAVFELTVFTFTSDSNKVNFASILSVGQNASDLERND